MIETITNVLGESKTVTRRYEDGSFDCPFCHNAVITPGTECVNPWCEANRYMPIPHLLARREKEEAERKDKEQRERNHQWAMERRQQEIETENEIRREAIDRGKREGLCLDCMFKSPYRITFVKHRKLCPKKVA